MKLAKFLGSYFDLEHVQSITELDYGFNPEVKVPDRDGIETTKAAHGHARFYMKFFGDEKYTTFQHIVNSQEPRYGDQLRWKEKSGEVIAQEFANFKQGYERLFEAWSTKNSSINIVNFGD